MRSTRDVTSDSATRLAAIAYDPFGEAAITGAVDAFTPLFTSHPVEPLSGDYSAALRSYDSTLGRWTSEDPEGFIDGPNLYAYVQNNVLAAIDPFGLQSKMERGQPNLPTGTPENCTATPWRWLGNERRTYQFKDWELLRQNTVEIVSPRGGRDADSVAFPICSCTYRLRSIIETNEIVQMYVRKVSCCSGLSWDQFGEVVQDYWRRDLPRIEPKGGIIVTRPGVAFGGGCNCEPPSYW